VDDDLIAIVEEVVEEVVEAGEVVEAEEVNVSFNQ
jgi:hypothetical protein